MLNMKGQVPSLKPSEDWGIQVKQPFTDGMNEKRQDWRIGMVVKNQMQSAQRITVMPQNIPGIRQQN